ncbi:MAG: hypothetical protein RL653_2831 [Pseudomonadota bacterium]|jgi:serine/threonine-protein kinase
MSTIAAGTVLDGRYEVVRELGEGGMATVYLVRHLGLHSEHALKVLNPEHSARQEVRARFLAEGRIQARVRHPNIVAVTEIVTQPVAGLVMDYVPGATLGEHLRKKGAFTDLSELTRLFLEVLEAVGEAHRHGVVHRDLKPENIILGRNSRGQFQARVTDFGVARVTEVDDRRTRFGSHLGTPQYMSPEQIRGAENADPRSDIFSLGAILYEMVTGQVAFSADSDFNTLQAVMTGTYVPPERLVDGLPPALGRSIQRALSVRPEERFQTCDEFAAALGGLPAVQQPGTGRPGPPSPRVTNPSFPSVPAAGAPQPWLWQLMRGAMLLSAPYWLMVWWQSPRRSGFTFESVVVMTLLSGAVLGATAAITRSLPPRPSLPFVLGWSALWWPAVTLPVSLFLQEQTEGLARTPLAMAWAWLVPFALSVWVRAEATQGRMAHPAWLAATVLVHGFAVAPPGTLTHGESQQLFASTALFAIWTVGMSALTESALASRVDPRGDSNWFPAVGPSWKKYTWAAALGYGALLLWGLTLVR